MCVNCARVFFVAVKRSVALLGLASFVLLQSCGGGGGGGSAEPEAKPAPTNQSVSGGGVKGPLAFAIVSAYTFDATQPNLRSATPVATGTTDATASIVGLALPLPLNAPYILEFTSDASTRDITTNAVPVISTMRTVLTSALLASGEQIYATPLTTMAVDVAIQNADSAIAPYTSVNDGTVTKSELLTALNVAAAQVVSTLGFGIDSSVDIFDTPPLIDSTTVTTAEQTAVAAYRTAVEALTAMVYELGQNSAATPISADEMLAALTADLSDGGIIDGSVAGSPIDANVLNDLITIDPNTLPIPNSAANNGGVDIVVGDVEQVLVAEKTTTGNDAVTTTELEPGGTIVVTSTTAQTNPSQDGDTIPDSTDNCPNDANEDQADTNSNGVGNACEAAPTANNDAASVDEGATLNSTSVLANDIDAEGDTLTPSILTGPSNAASFALNADGTFTYVHNGSETTNDGFTYQITDGALTSSASVVITINPVDDPTVLVADTNAITENSLPNTVSGNVLSNDTDPDTVLTVSNAAALTGPSTYGSLTIDSAGSYIYTLDNNNAAVIALLNGETLTEVFNYNANGVTQTLTITINGLDGNSVFTADTNGILEDGANPVSGNVLSNDTDPDTILSVTNAAALSGTGLYGSLTIDSTGAYSYTLDNTNSTVNALASGGSLTEIYSYQVNGIPASTLTITISGADDATILTADTASIAEDATPNTISGNVITNDNDPDTTLTVSNAVALSGTGTYGSLTISTNGAYTYTLDNTNSAVNALVNGDTLTETYNYSANGQSTTLAITINGNDDATSLTADTNSITEDSATNTASGNVLTNDSDTDTALTVSNAAALTGTGTYGSLTISSAGAYTYTLDNANTAVNALAIGSTLTDSYTYTANGVSSTLNITINGADDATTTTVDVAAITEDAATNTVSGNVLTNDSDPDTTLTVTNATALSGTGTYGSLSINSSGAYTYSLDNTNATVDALNAGESLTETYTYNTNGLSSTLTITINGVTDSTGSVDISGVWKVTFTSTPTTACPGTAGLVETYYFGIAQTGGALNIRTAEGVSLSGTINPATGAITSVTGSKVYSEANLTDINNLTPLNLTDSFILNGSATATTMTGTMKYTLDDSNGSSSCIDGNIAGTFVYKHSGTENYTGVHAIEFEENSEASGGNIYTERFGFPITLTFAGGALVDVSGIDNGQQLAGTNYVFDPATGYFSFDIALSYTFDNDGDGVIDITETSTDSFSGIFMANPITNPGANGQPLSIITGYGIARRFNNGTGLYESAANFDQNGYGKLLTTKAITRTAHFETYQQKAAAEQILIGISAVPTRIATPTSKLFLEVLDGTTVLCQPPLLTQGSNEGRYFEQINMPNPDFATQQFRSNGYSTITCNTNNLATGAANVTDGFLYTVRIIDTGADGVIGGTDDTYPTTISNYAAEVVPTAEQFTLSQDVFDIDVNGVKVSKTMGGAVVPYYGYFDSSETNVISWPAHPDGADQYQLRIHRDGDTVKERYTTTGTNYSLAPDTVDSWDANKSILRLVALKDASNGAKAMSFTRRIGLRNGIWGHWNIELGNDIPNTRHYRAFNIKIETQPNTGGSILCSVKTSKSFMQCDSASINYLNDTVTLNMTDLKGGLVGVGGTFDLVLNFKPNGVLNNGTAIVTSNTIGAIGTDVNASPAVARAANPEFRVRSMRMSNGDIQSSAIIYNPTNVASFDIGKFKVNDDSSLYIAGVTDGLTEVNFDVQAQMQDFISLPTNDQVAQVVGRFSRYRTSYDWAGPLGLLDANTYKLVQKSTTDATLKRVYRHSYTPLNSTNYVAPQLGDIQIVVPTVGTTACSTGVACTTTTPVDVSVAPTSFSVIWTVPTAPAGSFWRLDFRDVLGSRREVRTPAQQPNVVGSDITSVDIGGGLTTYTWVNPGIFNIKATQQWSIQVRLTNEPVYWDVGGFSRAPDMAHITVP